ncbi:hypothetical protein ACWGJ2_00075 [Streptomyces sp. NPDC054796]
MSSDLIGAVAGLLGLCLGSGATLLAARTTARASEKQAAAQQAQAVAAYRAALDSAREQVRAATAGQALAARRPVYAAFLRSAHTLADAVHTYVMDPSSETEPYLRAFDKARAAHADLELEGPEELAALGARVVNEAIAVRERGSGYASLLLAAGKVSALVESPGTMELGLAIERDLRAVQSASRRLPEGWRGRARELWRRPDDPFAFRTRPGPGEDAEEVPSDESVAALHAALDRAAEGSMHTALTTGALTEDDVWRLYWAATQWPEEEPATHVRALLAPVRDAARAFAREARAALHAPAEGPGSRGD